MIDYGMPAVMPAHVIYPEVDSKPAGFSRIWLQQVLRKRLEFQWRDFQRRPFHGGRSGRQAMLRSVRWRRCKPVATWCWYVIDPDLADELLENLDWNISAVKAWRGWRACTATIIRRAWWHCMRMPNS